MKPSNYYHIESRDERREPPQRGSWWVDAPTRAAFVEAAAREESRIIASRLSRSVQGTVN